MLCDAKTISLLVVAAHDDHRPLHCCVLSPVLFVSVSLSLSLCVCISSAPLSLSLCRCLSPVSMRWLPCCPANGLLPSRIYLVRDPPVMLAVTLHGVAVVLHRPHPLAAVPI